MDPAPDAAIGALKSRGLDSLPPLAIVLGSGLGAFADEARDAIAISYLDIPGFPGPERRGPRRASGGRDDRGRARGAVSGPRPLL